jgi:hypothetical protein
MNFRGIPRNAVIGGAAAAVAVAVIATSGIGQAAAVDGPVLHLSRHGLPTDCEVAVQGTLKDGSPYSDSMHRQTCDGTLWMPTLRKDTSLSVEVKAHNPRDGAHTHKFMVDDARDQDKDVIDNATAICFLVKAFADEVVYTGMSANGGECNGS